ncbi:MULTISPECIES: methyl-accepting chemotaxis protein [unclassified Herbaspirillum]|uniref:methyl-accepting chemotaxis protein n=1 Tax=unclassified Herbaspirillum TaxID=2624150 RepID=UPI00115439CF|nr:MULTISPECIES: methyl-accepting chemotaxis protein [unclassified Herbaspirillum]MBB5392570.1 methyl-accepting chemotaxis protein [Herbaspirillum sp. SJZ102]TQK06207.1 methyl-accepting chemotaxis protein [Herbaspirillum sp. SJZ130]TQK12315.1 methyl-accepting chemotaxis protein [Herbaspirillum sp. SJZ106]
MKSGIKVGTRLGLGFAWVVLLLVLVTAFGIYNMHQLQARFNNVVEVKNPESALVKDMMDTVAERSISLRNLMLPAAPEDVDIEAQYIDAQTLKYKMSVQKLQQLFEQSHGTTDEEMAALPKIKAQADNAEKLIVQAVEFGQRREAYELAQFLKDQYLPVQKSWQVELKSLAVLEDRLNKEAAAASAAAYAQARLLMLITSAIGVVTAILAAIWLTRHLLRKLGGEPDYAVKIAGQIAEGDLAVRINTRPGDTDSLMVAMRAMRDKLAAIVAEVRNGSETITTASSEIARGNLDLSSRTEQQAGALEETASSMEQLNSTVKQNAENAHQANGLALAASDVAVQGGSIVSQVVETMQSINASSQKVADIVSVIDGIAFQTNILALNAAVEAARAGEQGRGFAVVASEVRSLAQRSAAAAKEIKVLIGDSVGKVENGSKLVEQAGSTMNDIVASIKRVTEVMTEITHANSEQSSGIEQVNEAIIQIDDMTQQNAALVEQAAAAARSLQEQASGLQQLVSVFRLDASQSLAAQTYAGDERTIDVTPAAPELPAGGKVLAVQA